jgi:hypothetical protein
MLILKLFVNQGIIGSTSAADSSRLVYKYTTSFEYKFSPAEIDGIWTPTDYNQSISISVMLFKIL